MEVIERDDGLVVAEHGCTLYFAPLARWPAPERDAIGLARGRVLDIGCGPGRVALHLQRTGHSVTAIDPSPLTAAVARARGVQDARVLALEGVGSLDGRYDSFILFGDNFGLFRSRRTAARLLRTIADVAAPDARILAATRDFHQAEEPVDIAYAATNVARGRMAGQLRVRIRYRSYRTPWFDHLQVSQDEMAQLADLGGWRLADRIGDGAYFVGLLERRDTSTFRTARGMPS